MSDEVERQRNFWYGSQEFYNLMNPLTDGLSTEQRQEEDDLFIIREGYTPTLYPII